MSKGLEWLKVSSMVVTSAVGVAQTLIQYRKYRTDQRSWEITRRLQDRAWKQVLEGELSEARIGSEKLIQIQIKAPRRAQTTDKSPADKGKEKTELKS